jgi:hypothetical protein
MPSGPAWTSVIVRVMSAAWIQTARNTTLAYHLSYHHPALARRIIKVVEEDPELTGHSHVKQFDHLIPQPLQTPLAGQKLILLVIDALDECNEHDVGTILSLFAHEAPRIPSLKVFITARPEKHIRAILNQYRDHEQFDLHDIDKLIVEADIRSYLKFRLRVQSALPDLCSPIWQPTKEQKDTLVGMSGKLRACCNPDISLMNDNHEKRYIITQRML